MTAADILAILITVNIAASAAIIAVIIVRGAIRRIAGAHTAYLSWLAVPAAIAASLIPARIVTIEAPAPAAIASAPAPQTAPVSGLAPLAQPAPAPIEAALLPAVPASTPTAHTSVGIDWELGLVLVWAGVAIAALILLFFRQALAVRALGPLARISSTMSRAAQSVIGPAVVGIFAPRIVLPANFETTFDDTERKVVIAHEEAHLRGRHTAVKAIAEIAVCLNWFNPLVHIAARAVAMDQELACDEAVVRRYPEHRKAYATVLLKNQAGPRAPLGCYWPAGSARGLKTRITEIQRSALSRKRRAVGGGVLALLAIGAASAAWAAKPSQTRLITRPVEPPAFATASEVEAPSATTPQSIRFEPQQTPAAQTSEAPRWPEGHGEPSPFDLSPFALTGKVEKIDFRDQSYVVFVRAAYIAMPNYKNTSWGAQANTALWELSPTNYFGDAASRDAIAKDLANREIRATGVSATPEICKPTCKMTVTNLQMVQPTALAPLSRQSVFSFADLATRYDVNNVATFRGTVERIEFAEPMFDAYVRARPNGGVPGAVYQVRSEYRFPRADIEQQLLNKTVVVAGWPSKTGGDTVCETGCGLYATDIQLAGGASFTPTRETLVSAPQPKPAFRDEPGVPPTIMPGMFERIDRMNRFDMTAPITIEGRIVSQDSEGVVVEAQRFEPASAPGARPGTLWRVASDWASSGIDSVGLTISARGFIAKDKSCQPTCMMSGGPTWVRP
jgi:beta-lactamase regulating signal transducer with metallopeptidase domain